MPLDGTVNTPALNRARLVDALRNDTEWQWNFCDGAGCAIGMARVMWPGVNVCNHLGLTNEQYGNVFGFIAMDGNSCNRLRGLPPEWCDFYGMERTEVTPQMVADALEGV